MLPTNILSVAIVFATLFQLPANAQIQYESIKLNEASISEIKQNTFDAESLVVSPDESQLCWIGESRPSKLPPNDIFIKNIASHSIEKIDLCLRKSLNLFTKCSFTRNNAIVTDELEYAPGAILRSTIGYFQTKDWEPIGYHSTVSIYSKMPGSKKIAEYDYRNFGISSQIQPEHPRISPDGKWIAFYLEGKNANEGIYLYNRETGSTKHLGDFLDKHPTWSADGSKVLFHHQGTLGNSKIEIAEVGYYQLSFQNSKILSSKRVILNDSAENTIFGSKYIYEKHPTMHVGLNLIFAHAQKDSEGKKSILVRSLTDPKKVMLLKMSYQGKKIKAAKHPTTSFLSNSALYFVGKLEDEKREKIFKVDYSELEKISSALQGVK